MNKCSGAVQWFLPSLSSIVTIAEDPSAIPDVLDKDTIKNSLASTISSSVVENVIGFGPVSLT